MHLSEGILPAKQMVSLSVLAIPFIIDSYFKCKSSMKSTDQDIRKPFFTMAMAMCFAVTLLPIPVPVAGASSHMCATPLLSLILGPRLIPFSVLSVLLLQAVFFAHGGLTTLGANVLTLGVIGPIMTLLVLSLLRRCKISGSLSIGIACFVGSISVYFADSLILSWSLAQKQYFFKTFQVVTLGFLPVPFLGSFLGFLPSVTLSDIIL